MKLLNEVLQFAARQSRLTRLGLYAAFGLGSFLVALYASIPRDRIRERLERELSQDSSPTTPMGTGMDVTIGDLGLSLISPGVNASEIQMKERVLPGATLPDGRKPLRYFVDTLQVRLPLLDQLIGRRTVELLVSAFGGSLDGEGGTTSDEAFIKAKSEHLSLALLPGVAQAVPIPIGGSLDLSADVKIPLDAKTKRTQFSATGGQVEFTIEDAVVGNGKAKLVLAGNPFLAQGMTVPRVALGHIEAKIVIEKGRATVTTLHSKSADGEATLEGYVDLRDPLPMSELHLYLRFRPSPALLKRESSLELIINAAAAQAKRADGALGFSFTGIFAAPRALPAKDPPGGVTVHAGRSIPGLGPGPAMGAASSGGLGALPRPASPSMSPSLAPPNTMVPPPRPFNPPPVRAAEPLPPPMPTPAPAVVYTPPPVPMPAQPNQPIWAGSDLSSQSGAPRPASGSGIPGGTGGPGGAPPPSVGYVPSAAPPAPPASAVPVAPPPAAPPPAENTDDDTPPPPAHTE